MVLQRRNEAPKSWLNKQRHLVNGEFSPYFSLSLCAPCASGERDAYDVSYAEEVTIPSDNRIGCLRVLGTSYSELDGGRSPVDKPPFLLFLLSLMHGDGGSQELQDSFLGDGRRGRGDEWRLLDIDIHRPAL